MSFLSIHNPQPDARGTIAKYQRALRTYRIYDECMEFYSPAEQAMLSLVWEKLNFVQRPETPQDMPGLYL